MVASDVAARRRTVTLYPLSDRDLPHPFAIACYYWLIGCVGRGAICLTTLLALTDSAEPAFLGQISRWLPYIWHGNSIYNGLEEHDAVHATPLKFKTGLQPECLVYTDETCSDIQWCCRTPLIKTATRPSQVADR